MSYVGALFGDAVISGWVSCVERLVDTYIHVFCGARSAIFCALDTCGARFAGTLGKRNRIARAMLDRVDETPLAKSRWRCFILRSRFWIRVKSFVWHKIFASVEFSHLRGPRVSIYS